MIAHQMKNAISEVDQVARKSVSLSALAVLVLREPHVRPPTIVKYAHASILFREMAILHVLNVRQKFVGFIKRALSLIL